MKLGPPTTVTTSSTTPMKTTRVRRAVLAIVCVVSSAAWVTGCTPPSQQDVETAQALSELGGSFSDLRQVQVELQDQVDSLRGVVARQDSLIRTLANLAGVSIAR